MDARCRIELFGDLRVVQNDQITTRFRTHKAAMLLAYLALYRTQSHPRERLLDLFWPDMEMEAGRDNLSTALSALRRQLEPAGVPTGSLLIADRQNVRLNAENVTTDVAEFEQALRAATRAEAETERAVHLARAVGLYRGDLLPGCYDDWAIQEQSRLSAQLTEALQQWSETLERAGRYEETLPIVQRLVSADPYDEAAVQTQMRLLARLGRAAVALEQYQKLERMLREELDVTPARATRELAERLRRDPNALSIERPVSPAKPVPIPEPKAAVLPAETALPPPAVLNLPLQLTRFFGREHELAELEQHFVERETRLVTLLGPGGTGKTRLAIETAKRVATAFGGRVWFVALADIPDASLIPSALTHALKLPPAPGADPLERVVEFLGAAPCFLVLDNMEHLLRDHPTKSENRAASGSAPLIRLLLQRAPGLKCLVTSRQALRLGGEQEFPLPPLGVPQAQETPEGLLAVGSVALYTDRARIAKPDFALTQNNAEAVAALCRKLEGMPLAIEMAAAWAKTLPPARMLERLERQLDLMVSRRRDLPPRHQSLRATIEWSYDLLEPELRTFFARLSVFRGGWTLEAAEAVCGDEALNVLMELQEQSLIVIEETEEETRYRLLEPLREFAAEKLQESGESERFRRAHAETFLALAEEIGLETGPKQAECMDRLEGERDNLRAAMAWCLEGEAGVLTGIRLAAHLWRFWQLRDHVREGRVFAEQVLARPEGRQPSLIRAKALHAAHAMAWIQGDYATSHQHLIECEAIARELENREALARALNELGIIAQEQGDNATAQARYEEALKINRELGERSQEAVVLSNLGVVAESRNDLETARQLYEAALAIQREQDDRRSIAITLNNLGDLARTCGDFAAARRCQCESLSLGQQLGNKRNTAYVFESLAELAQAEGDCAWAAHLFGAAENLRTLLDMPLAPSERATYDQAYAATRQALGERAFTIAYQAGQKLTLDEAILLALKNAGYA